MTSPTLAELGAISKANFDYLGAIEDSGLPKMAAKFLRRTGKRASTKAGRAVDTAVKNRVSNAGTAVRGELNRTGEQVVNQVAGAGSKAQAEVARTARSARNQLALGGVVGGAALGGGAGLGYLGAKAYDDRKRRNRRR